MIGNIKNPIEYTERLKKYKRVLERLENLHDKLQEFKLLKNISKLMNGYEIRYIKNKSLPILKNKVYL